MKKIYQILGIALLAMGTVRGPGMSTGTNTNTQGQLQKSFGDNGIKVIDSTKIWGAGSTGILNSIALTSSNFSTIVGAGSVTIGGTKRFAVAQIKLSDGTLGTLGSDGKNGTNYIPYSIGCWSDAAAHDEANAVAISTLIVV